MKTEHNRILDLYIMELRKRESLIQNSTFKSMNLTISNDSLKRDIISLKSKSNELEKLIDIKNYELNSIIKEEKILNEKLEEKNLILRKNLENLTELEYANYFKESEAELKKFKIIYGNRYAKKVNESQKMKFMERLLCDHTLKKDKINEFMHFIFNFEDSVEYLNESIVAIEEDFYSVIKF